MPTFGRDPARIRYSKPEKACRARILWASNEGNEALFGWNGVWCRRSAEDVKTPERSLAFVDNSNSS